MPASGTIYGLRGIWWENDASRLSVHPSRVRGIPGHKTGAKSDSMGSVEGAILIWLAIGAGIAGGVFIIARAAVQIGSVIYRVMEKQLSRQAATRETALLSMAMIAALVVTAIVAGYAIYAIFGQLLETNGAINTLNNGS